MNMPSTGTPFNTPVEIFHWKGADGEYCNARDLHKALQVETRFNDWVSRRIKEYGFIEGIDFYSILSKTLNGRAPTDYQLTLDMAKELAMVERTDIGRRVRHYFIKAEAHARHLLQEQANQVQPIEQVKNRIKDTGKFKYLLILQEQSRTIAKALANATDHAERYNLHCQLRQVNEALGIPTLPLGKMAENDRIGPPKRP